MSPSPASPWNRWRTSPWLAYILPLTLFLLLQSLPGILRAETGPAPWWRLHPEHWVYPLQTLLALSLLAFWWPRYDLTLPRPSQALLALLLGSAGAAVWIAPVALGWMDRPGGFDPPALGDAPALLAPILAFRLLRLVLVAPLIEEIFWRGFLQRYLVDTSADFWKIPMGTFTWTSAIWTTAGVVLIHDRADWPAALLWGVLVAFLYVRTRSLSACVLMHAIANLLLGAYILRTASWGLW